MSTSKHIILEEQKKVTPAVLFVDINSGAQNPLLYFLVEKMHGQTKPYVLSLKPIPPDAERISFLSVHFLDKLDPPLEYAVLFLDDEGKKDKILEIIEKLEPKNTRIIVLVPYRKLSAFIDVFITCKDTLNLSFVLVGDIFGKHIPLAPLSELIDNALSSKKITIYGDNLQPIYPISEDDAKSGIEYILFGAKKVSYLYSLFYKTPQTLISLAHVLKRIEPELSISLRAAQGKQLLQKTSSQNEAFLKSRVGILPLSLANVFMGLEKSLSLSSSTQLKSNKKKKIRLMQGKNLGIFKAFLSVLLCGFVLYVFLSFFLFGVSILFFKAGVASFLTGNIQSATNEVNAARSLYNFTNMPVRSISDSLFFAFPSMKQNFSVYNTALITTSEALTAIAKIQSNYENLKEKDLKGLIASLTQVYFFSQRIDLPNVSYINENKLQNASKFLSLLPVVPILLGFDREKHYLLLFQNNNELRPTGGFIGSVGELTIEKGNIKKMNVQDVYALDGQLKGHVEPHPVIRRFLQPHLYLRDSNFSPSFEDAASTSASLYNLETGRKVDGVFALDTEVLKKIVEIVGPVSVPGISQKINPQNVSNLLHKSITDNFFPGSTNKKDILSTLLSKIVIILTTDPKLQREFVKSMPNLIMQKHILFSVADKSVENAFIATSFAGSLFDLRTKESTIKDFLSVSEANIGVNKVNEFVERSITYTAFIKDAEVDSDILLDLKNNGAEDYKAFIRIIIPEKAELLNIEINGVDQSITPFVTDYKIYERSNFKVPKGLEVLQTKENNQKLIGFITTVPPKKSQRIHVLYKTPYRKILNGVLTYSLYYIKQPGTLPYKLTVQVIPGNGLTQIQNALGSSSILFDSTILSDIEVDANFLEKK